MRPLIASLRSGWTRANDGNAGIIAAGVAYYGFLALVPLLAAALLTYGLVVEPETIAAQGQRLAQTLPAGAGTLVADQLESVAASRGGATGLGLVAAIALSLFGARVAAGALITALNMAFDASRARGFLKANLLALGITLAVVIALGLLAGVTALMASVFSGVAGSLASFAVIGMAGLGGAVLAYRTVPNVRWVDRAAAMRGAVLFALGWMAASAGFGIYASNFGHYNATYGSLGAVVAFLTWLWLSAWLLLLGAHVAAASIGRR
ncbi:MAG: YihY family inner membrane protein [Porphyrobacter sp.]|nr:YihY family inner membrane protein [Porphyrobacter sp.]